MKISFFVAGIPKPGGSKKGFIVAGRVNIVEACKGSKSWRAAVAKEAKKHHRGPLLDEPLEVEFTFYATRPKCQYRTGKNSHLLKSDAPKYPVGKPDALKLARSTEDALTGVVWKDDARTIDLHSSKRYGTVAGCMISIWTVERVLNEV